MKTDIYQRITDQIVSELEKGVRPWLKPWNAEHAAGHITRPLRGSGIPYQGINVLTLWSAAMEKGYAAPVWMTFKQASELKANVRKGEHGSLVVYADKIIRTEADTVTGEEAERAIPFMKGYTVSMSSRSTVCRSITTPSPNPVGHDAADRPGGGVFRGHRRRYPARRHDGLL
jgi:antirestriction protein ArdC